jgi:hypothetical protein
MAETAETAETASRELEERENQASRSHGPSLHVRHLDLSEAFLQRHNNNKIPPSTRYAHIRLSSKFRSIPKASLKQSSVILAALSCPLSLRTSRDRSQAPTTMDFER